MSSPSSSRLTRLTTLSLLLSSTLVYAQEVTSAAESAAAASATQSAITHTVAVAKAGFTFSPDVTLADVGDYIEFDFYPTNHSVARAEYGYPCIPYEDTGVDKIGFFSGFEPVDAILADPPKYTIRVNDTLPIFYYCTAPGSCINYGMVGVINPNASTPLAVQRQLAENSTFMLQPGEPWPSETTPDPFTMSSATPSPTTMSTSTSSTVAAATSAAATSVPASSKHSSLGTGAIAGIAIGGAAVAILAAALLYMCGRSSRRSPPAPPAAPFDPHASYAYSAAPPMDPKHMTMVTNRSSDATGLLPSYMPHSPRPTDPAMRPFYVPSDAHNQSLSPASEAGTGRSPSPTQMMRGVGVPPYSPNSGMASVSGHDSVDGRSHQLDTNNPNVAMAPGVHQVHEMYAPAANGQGGGIMNFVRQNSTGKSGVERYS